jgi:serine/threonine protein kinase
LKKKYDIKYSGVTSTVYKAVHKIMQKEFCVKEIEKSQLESTKEKIQVEGELTRLKKLDHKNILRVYEKFETPEKIYFVLEL